jgi:hypothetical protein
MNLQIVGLIIIQFSTQVSRYHRSQTLGYRNGYALPTQPSVGIGGAPINYNLLSEAELNELANYNPTLTYGQAKQAPPEDFIPAHVAWDKKVLALPLYYHCNLL